MLKARPADTAPETASLRVRAVLRWEGGPRDNTHSETPGRSTTFTSPPLIRGVQGDGEQLHVGSLHSWCRGWKSVKRSHSDHKAGQTHACVPRRRHGAHWMRMRTSRGPPPHPTASGGVGGQWETREAAWWSGGWRRQFQNPPSSSVALTPHSSDRSQAEKRCRKGKEVAGPCPSHRRTSAPRTAAFEPGSPLMPHVVKMQNKQRTEPPL